MFSSAVSSGTSWPNWNTNPKWSRRSALRLASPIASIRRPSNQISPESGARMPERQCSSVDLPDPLGPITARISPAATDAGTAKGPRLAERPRDVARLDRPSAGPGAGDGRPR